MTLIFTNDFQKRLDVLKINKIEKKISLGLASENQRRSRNVPRYFPRNLKILRLDAIVEILTWHWEYWCP